VSSFWGVSSWRSTTAKEKYHHGNLRAALLEAALAVISEIGPRGLSIREMARRAGVAHAAPYRHFADRDELILAVVKQGFNLMQQTIQAEKAAAPDDPLNQFAASGQAYVNFALQHPAYHRVMFGGDPVLQALAILSTIHGFVSLVNDNRIGHLLGNPYSLENVRDAVLVSIFDGLGAQRAPAS